MFWMFSGCSFLTPGLEGLKYVIPDLWMFGCSGSSLLNASFLRKEFFKQVDYQKEHNPEQYAIIKKNQKNPVKLARYIYYA